MKTNGDDRENVRIPINLVYLDGILNLPKGASGVVIFAHGSGSSRFSPRNNFVAHILRDAKLGTLLFDLLTEEEDSVYDTRFDINLLAQRLAVATDWLLNQPETRSTKIGYFGASTGAAAALQAAAEMGSAVSAIVSRGGRPDLAMRYLPKVKSPTLLIVGGHDEDVIELNRFAYNEIHCEKYLAIISGATHLFEEPGKLEEVAILAKEWFLKYLQ